MIKIAFFTLLTLAFFYIIWINNVFAPHETYEMPVQYQKIAEDERYAKEGKQLFEQNCQACHSVRYDAVYPSAVQANPNLKALQEQYGKVLPKDVYESAFYTELSQLKESFGKVPPDLSTMYIARGKEYLFNFILEPQKVLPGTSMPAVMTGRPEETAKIISYLRSVSEPPPSEKAKRTLMGIATIAYLVVMGVLIWVWRAKILKRMGLH
ncbi:cytochrome c1 [Hydrogenobacter hydrogenophilus]|uniref:Ubiquinol-cytochrome c reductase cytochrome c1 subunit n=1 Tax=Hydrogenobacter hydrogenophilus TaxID=35835 RepID=A0A285P1K1_9AQUI|nr:c-type cytochrome [Hydrogenobacter hydrogenophilus]SNZ15328.1 ubiquinol-cytochrome c reductase cytochrome c1 subunit [Hydrogenobacter hydrogenophilus]